MREVTSGSANAIRALRSRKNSSLMVRVASAVTPGAMLWHVESKFVVKMQLRDDLPIKGIQCVIARVVVMAWAAAESVCGKTSAHHFAKAIPTF